MDNVCLHPVRAGSPPGRDGLWCRHRWEQDAKRVEASLSYLRVRWHERWLTVQGKMLENGDESHLLKRSEGVHALLACGFGKQLLLVFHRVTHDKLRFRSVCNFHKACGSKNRSNAHIT